MRLIEDKTGIYAEPLLKTLRAYNFTQTGEKFTDSAYFYAFRKGELIGALKANLFWDWVSIDEVIYKNGAVLQGLVHAVQGYYENRAVGIKSMSESKAECDDFCALGFRCIGVIPKTPLQKETYHLVLNQTIYENGQDVEVTVSNEAIQAYESIFIPKESGPSEEKIWFIALENDVFLGGLEAIIRADELYISRLAVEAGYRKIGLGSQLMDRAELYARKAHLFRLMLGTTAFQARGFYEKLGFEVILCRRDEPLGFESYKMIKVIDKE